MEVWKVWKLSAAEINKPAMLNRMGILASFIACRAISVGPYHPANRCEGPYGQKLNDRLFEDFWHWFGSCGSGIGAAEERIGPSLSTSTRMGPVVALSTDRRR